MTRPAAAPYSARQGGAALLLAMLTVALVATLAAAALWQQWRSVEMERSDRDRVQAGWILSGALDWAGLILAEHATGADHLGEAWSVPLAESRLSTFLSMDGATADGADDVFLSGRILDAQARMNVANLLASGKVSEPDVQAFERLFELLGLEPAEVEPMAQALRLALDTGADANLDAKTPLLPRRVEQLPWLGLPAASLQRLAPHVSVLPVRTPLNLNTADAEVLAASVPGLDLAGARRVVAERERKPFNTLAEASRAVAGATVTLDASRFGVATRFFEVQGRLRMEHSVIEERSLVQRNGRTITTLWRERFSVDPQSPPAQNP